MLFQSSKLDKSSSSTPADTGLYILPDYHFPEFLVRHPEFQKNSIELRTRLWKECELRGYVYTFQDVCRWQIAECIAKYCTSPEAAAALFRDVWTASKTSAWAERKHNKAMLRQISAANYPHLFAPEDWEVFHQSPSTFKLYPGGSAYNSSDMSWTVDRDRAEFFARSCLPIMRYAGSVMERTVRKSSVLFYTSKHKEQEITLPFFTVGAVSGFS